MGPVLLMSHSYYSLQVYVVSTRNSSTRVQGLAAAAKALMQSDGPFRDIIMGFPVELYPSAE